MYPRNFATESEAKQAADDMRGWGDVCVVRVDGTWGDPDTWQVWCDGGALCNDGFVRWLR